MAVPEWLFGPAGDLRPLPSTEVDVTNTVQRFGGVHNAINGARTVDVLGHRANYELEMTYLTPAEYHWLEALYTETIPGPFYLIDPLRKNLFSREAATARPADASRRGVRAINSSGSNWIRVTDSPVSWLQRGIEWTNLTVFPDHGAGIELDGTPLLPLVDSTAVTVSVYAKTNEDVQIHWAVRYFDESEQYKATDNTHPMVTLPAGEWTRVSWTFANPPTDALMFRPEFWYEPGGSATTSTKIQLLGFQAEYGTEATDLALGGGSIKVVIDTMDTTSPRYPLQSVSLSLLEV